MSQEDVEGLAIFGAEWGRAGTELKADGEVIKKESLGMGP